MKKTYPKRRDCDKLPRKSNGQKCQAILTDGQFCKRDAVQENDVCLNPEHLYGMYWVRVYLCKKHCSVNP